MDYFTPDQIKAVTIATNEVLTSALGPTPDDLTPGNKYWILKAMLFEPVGKYQWTHPALGDVIIWFDIQNDLLLSIVSRVFRAGYKTKQNETR